jgi:hypothetical protein
MMGNPGPSFLGFDGGKIEPPQCIWWYNHKLFIYPLFYQGKGIWNPPKQDFFLQKSFKKQSKLLFFLKICLK